MRHIITKPLKSENQILTLEAVKEKKLYTGT